MPSLHSLDLFLFSLTRAFCTPIPVFVQIQEQREKQKINDSMRNGNRFAFLCYDINELEHFNQVNLLRVTVIMPLKGFGEHNLHNWRSQITSLYGGPLEFLFVVESKEDPAYKAVSRLLSEFEVGTENMHKDSKYVLFLDDDVRLHPGSIGALTREMEKTLRCMLMTLGKIVMV